jgi:acyl-CoA synthetase (NDP forming)
MPVFRDAVPGDLSPAGRSMRVFRDPASVAVVGATDNPAKWGHWLARGALTGADRRDVYLVNARADSVLGHGVFRSLRDLPVVPELVVLAVPSADAVVAEAAELGVHGLVGITSEVRVPVGDMRVLGPNCLGLYDSSAELDLAWGRFTPGPMAIVSQSGQVGMEIAGLAPDHGLGVSRFVSVGDQVDVTLDEVLADLVDHASTRLAVLYAEDFGDGRALVRTLTRLRAAGKPVIVLTVGGSEAGRAAARSHTGALTSSLDVVDAACRAAGAIRVRTPLAAAGLAHILSNMEVTGDRVAIVTDSGGQGALAADLATDLGLRVPPLSLPSLGLPARGSARNPVDLAGLGEQDLGSYGRIVRAVAASVDTVLLTGYFGCYGVDTPSLADREAEVAASFPANVVVHSMATGGPAVELLRRRGIPVFRDVGSALAALKGAVRSVRTQSRALPSVSESSGPVETGYLAARTLLDGVPFPRCAAVCAVEDLEPPYVLKADWIAHKSEAGAVVLGLRTAEEVWTAHASMLARLGEGRYVVEEMDTRPSVVEMIVGARRDPAFGPVVVVGAGGVRTELLQDTALELAPVDASTALAMVRRLRCAPLLDGWRGSSGVDIGALVDVIVRVSSLIASRPDIAEIELNPVRAGASGALAVDALVVPR